MISFHRRQDKEACCVFIFSLH